MKRMTLLCFAAATSLNAATPLFAEDPTVLERWEEDRTQVFEASEVTKAELQWLARPLVVFADTPNDPRFQQQMDRLAQDPEDLAERDVLIITDTDPDAMSEWRTTLRPRGYMMALIGKDGRVA